MKTEKEINQRAQAIITEALQYLLDIHRMKLVEESINADCNQCNPSHAERLQYVYDLLFELNRLTR